MATNAPLIVDQLGDVDDGNYGAGELTLREAVNLANADPDADTITFDLGDAAVIALDGAPLTISEDLTINGGGAAITLNGGYRTRLVEVRGAETDATLQGLTLTGGYGAADTGGRGSAIDSEGRLSLVGSALVYNVAEHHPSVVWSEGLLTVQNATVSANLSDGNSRGILFADVATVENSTVTTNLMYRSDYLNGIPGAISAANTLTLIANSILQDNIAQDFGIIDYDNYDLDYNSRRTAEQTASIIGGDPVVGMLQPNGGPTVNRAPLAGSLAVDGGDNAFVVGTTDQRGAPRIADGDGDGRATVDVGAVEGSASTPSPAATYVVDKLGDVDDGNYGAGELTLREALFLANRDASADTIRFDLGAAATVTLGGRALYVFNPVTIDGGGAAITIDADGLSRVFDVVATAGASAMLDGLTITGGSASMAAGVRIRPAASLKLLDSTVTDNIASPELDWARYYTVGGAIRNEGAFASVNSTISGNLIETADDYLVSASGYGSALGNIGTATLTHTTVTANNNEATRSSFAIHNTGSLVVENSVVAGNDGDAFLGEAPILEGVNVVEGDPLLMPLADNGGPTRTHLPFAGSPLLDTADDALAPATDQRGVARPADGDGDGAAHADIGAVETVVDLPPAPEVLVVDALGDVDDGDYTAENLTLREAVSLANIASDANTIRFDLGEAATIVLDGIELTVAGPLTLDAEGQAITIEADGQSRVLNQRIADAPLTVIGLTLTGGQTLLEGGAIRSSGELTLIDATVVGNMAPDTGIEAFGVGGGVFGEGAVTLIDSVVTGNTAAYGGGVAADTVTALRSSITDNLAVGHWDNLGNWSYGSVRGGGIFAGDVLLIDSNVSGNGTSEWETALGGGIYADAVTVVNGTVSGNTLLGGAVGWGSGGGIHADEITLVNATISGNVHDLQYGGSPGDGGGVAGNVMLFNSVVAGNWAGGANDDVGGTIVEQVASIVGGDGRALFADTVEVAPGIYGGVASDNRGPTPTVALLTSPDNPALDAGHNDAAVWDGTALAGDQRGETRVADGDGDGVAIVDIGAFELQPPPSVGDEVTVALVGAKAGADFTNLVGWYDTATGEAAVLFADAAAAVGAVATVAVPDAERLGFFLVPDGGDDDFLVGGAFAGRDPRTLDLRVVEQDGRWVVATADGTALEGRPVHGGAAEPLAWFTEAAKNPDGIAHVDAPGTGVLGFEDLFGGGDRDFNDVVLRAGTPVAVTLDGAAGSFANLLGWYDPLSGAAELLVTDPEAESGTTVELLVPDPARLEFFVVPDGGDGFAPGGRFAGEDPTDLEVAVVERGGAWLVETADGRLLEGRKYGSTGLEALAYFSETAKNPDGAEHFAAAGERLGVEDFWQGGDGDFDDLVLTVDLAPDAFVL